MVMGKSWRRVGIVSSLVGLCLTISLPALAHVSRKVPHLWKHLLVLADQRYYQLGGTVADSQLLDGMDSTDFATTGHNHAGLYAPASHTHSGNDITTGTVAEVVIAAAIARDAEVMGIILANDGSGSGLDADLLDGQSGSFYTDAGNL